MKSTNWRYWLCQVLGWGVWGAFGMYLTFVVYKESFENMYSTTPEQLEIATKKYYYSFFITFICAILITHLLRFGLKKMDWLKYSFNNLLLIFLFSSILVGFFLYYVSNTAEEKLNVSLDKHRKELKLEVAKKIEKDAGLDVTNYYTGNTKDLSAHQQELIGTIKKNTAWSKNIKGEWVYKQRSNLGAVYQTIILVGLWLLIYFIWHYVERNRRDQMDRFKLENMVKELELKTIKAHINPHFIFNSLNSIRALVDENPTRARGAITELSNLLRSSMVAEKTETVSLEKEMRIVEDYLALEKIRFEDRLKVEYIIDEDTLDQEVPPMMVQTLVENAIKHGISKLIDGGTIKIYSDFVNSHYELKVENTGKLSEKINKDGFGLQGTQDRLKLLFGEKSSFKIYQASENSVAVVVTLPVKINSTI
jgi:two-component sensor histidine kinase